MVFNVYMKPQVFSKIDGKIPCYKIRDIKCNIRTSTTYVHIVSHRSFTLCEHQPYTHQLYVCVHISYIHQSHVCARCTYTSIKDMCTLY